MQPHEERVVAEKLRLDERITTLVEFICTSPFFTDMTREDRNLMREQRDAMQRYSDILHERIMRFSENP